MCGLAHPELVGSDQRGRKLQVVSRAEDGCICVAPGIEQRHAQQRNNRRKDQQDQSGPQCDKGFHKKHRQKIRPSNGLSCPNQGDSNRRKTLIDAKPVGLQAIELFSEIGKIDRLADKAVGTTLVAGQHVRLLTGRCQHDDGHQRG